VRDISATYTGGVCMRWRIVDEWKEEMGNQSCDICNHIFVWWILPWTMTRLGN